MGIFVRKDSRWFWYWIEGTTIRKSTGVPIDAPSPAQAREQRRQADAIYAAAKTQHALAHAGLAPKPRPTITFRAFAAWYERHVVATQRGHVRASSMLRQLTLHFGGVTDLAAITPATVREWMTRRRTQVAPATVNREYDVLRSLLRAAVPEYLAEYPLQDIRRLRTPEAEMRVLTFEEEQRLLAVCGPADRAFLLMALDTLLRLGSLLSLQWDQVKIDQRAIVALNAKVATKPKPISTRLLQALRELPRTGPYVFEQFRGARDEARGQAPKNRATRRFELLCRLANVPHGRAVNGVTIHCLRHTGATRALQAGASVKTVMDLGGWRLSSTVMRYVHATDQDVQIAAESIGTPRKTHTL